MEQKRFERPPPPPRTFKPTNRLVRCIDVDIPPENERNRSCTADETQTRKGSNFRRTVSAMELGNIKKQNDESRNTKTIRQNTLNVSSPKKKKDLASSVMSGNSEIVHKRDKTLKSLFRPQSLKRKKGSNLNTEPILENQVNEAEEYFNSHKKNEREKLNLRLSKADIGVKDNGEDYSDSLFHVPNIPRVIEIYGREHYYQIRHGTIYKLVERLTSLLPEFIDEYTQFVKIFFTTYRTFATPKQVLELIIRRFKGYEGIDLEEAEKWAVPFTKIQQGACFALAQWYSDHFRDFSSNSGLKKQLSEFVTYANENKHPNSRRDLVGYMSKIIEEKNEKGTYLSFYSVVIDKKNCPPSILPKDLKTATFMDLNDLEIARQLTLEEFNIYAEIQPEELQELAWSKEELKERAPNLLQMIDRFNHVSSSFATLIVEQPKLKLRKKILEKLIIIIEHLHNMNSFNMEMAVLSAFGQSPVHRLIHTFQSIKPKYLESAQKFQTIFNSEGSYKNYREAIKNIEPPAIPFLGVYLSDLTFIDQGNDEKVNGLINFRKKQLEYEVIIQVLRFQDTSFQFNIVPQIANKIKNLKVLPEDEMYNTSLQIEPRDAKRKDLK